MFNYSCEIMITHHSIVGIRSHTTPQDCIGPLHECNNEQFKSLQYGFRQTVERFQHLSKMWTKNNGFEFDWMSFIKFCNRLNPVQVLILRLSSLVGSLRTFVLCRRFSTENSTSNSLVSMALAHCLCKFQFLNPITLFLAPPYKQTSSNGTTSAPQHSQTNQLIWK